MHASFRGLEFVDFLRELTNFLLQRGALLLGLLLDRLSFLLLRSQIVVGLYKFLPSDFSSLLSCNILHWNLFLTNDFQLSEGGVTVLI